MGLDMYLNKRIYIGAEYEHRNVKGVINLTEGKDNKPIKINLSRVSYIEEGVGYWRKANQIHKWFVENVQEGKDDCGDYSVGEEKLKELLSLCQKIKDKCKLIAGVVANGYTFEGGEKKPIMEDGKIMTNQEFAHSLLPCQSGFFFGGTDYDEYYMADIEDTIEIIETLFKEKGDEEYLNGDIYYHSSW